MNTIARETINERIAELEGERDALVQQANQQISAYGGAIGELRRLLEPPKPAEQTEQAEHLAQE